MSRFSDRPEAKLACAFESGERPAVSRGTRLIAQDSQASEGTASPAVDAGPLGWLPRVSHRQLGLEQRLERWARNGGMPLALDWLRKELGAAIAIDRPEILWRASGMGRAGLVAQMTAPRLATRLAVGIEIPLAHTIVDHLLGFDRSFGETRLQLTPVEWGVWTFLFLRALDSFDAEAGPESRESTVTAGHVGLGELTLDRVGPDPFDPSGLGSVVTVRWPIRIGDIAGAARLWLPDSVVSLWLAAPIRPGAATATSASRLEDGDLTAESVRRVPRGELASTWRAIAGLVTMSQGLRRLRTGGVLPLSDSRLTGTPASPGGAVDLILDLEGEASRLRIPTSTVADSGGRLVRLEAGPVRESRPRDPIVVTKSENQLMSQSTPSPATPSAAGPLDVPVTLTVELGRVNLTLTQLADLKPGDVVELNRHSRAPVELTSNGRLVARGELILIDTDLGVRVTNVFL
jgi:type III secretion system YscQ/HrcQ family protein